MDSVLIMGVAFVGYLLAYRIYGRHLAFRIFGLDPERVTPAHTEQDGVDFVPTHKQVIFGHHFTSIAGTGPIVGPAIGIIWGWVPALLWVFFGAVFMGAVHDLGSLIVSLRNKGRSLAEVTGIVMNRHLRIAFFIIVFLALLIVIAIFGMIIAVLFSMYPQAVLPVWMEIPIAMALGWFLYHRGAGLFRAGLAAVVAMYITVILGHYLPFAMPSVASIPPTGVWTILLLLYAFIASFAGTTLDTATRIQRYVITELAVDFSVKPLVNRYVATAVAVLTAAALAFYNGAGGSGALTLWPLFGAINQLLAGLALIVVSFYLRGLGRNYLYTLIPALLVLVFTSWSLIITLGRMYATGNTPRLIIGSIALGIEAWLVVEGLVLLLRPPAVGVRHG